MIAHRGASGHAPENSIAAFRIAAGHGPFDRCDGVELDIQATADGEFVVHHDAALPSGEVISEISRSRVRASRLRDGTPVPTLAEALDAIDSLDAYVEVKHLRPADDANLVTILAGRSRGHVAVHAFDHRVIARLHQIAPKLSLGVLSRSYPVDPIHQVLSAGALTLWQEAHLVDEALVVSCRSADISLVAWTVNDAADATRLTRLGVDGLCGNWPERLR